MGDGGKGSRQRPPQVSQEELAARWEAIFGKKAPKGKKEEQLENIGSAGLSSKTGNVDCPSCKCGEVCSGEEA